MTETVPESAANSSSAVLDRDGGLVFVAMTPAGSGVFAVRPGQREPALIVDNGFSPKVTSDGRTILFARAGDNRGLYRVNADGSGQALLVEGSGTDAQILPDDRSVVFISIRSGLQTLWSVPLEGGAPRQLLQQFVAAGSLNPSPDGRLLVFGAGLVNGRSVRKVCDLPDCTNLRDWDLPSGRWMPDGRGVAYVNPSDVKNIWVRPIDGGAARPLTQFTDKVVVDFGWSPDGKRLAVTRGSMLIDIVLIKGIR